MNQSLTIILYLIFSGTALFGETPGKLAATTQDPGPQPGKPSGNPTDQPSERSAEELLGKAAEAVKAVQTWVKEDRILGPLSTAKPRADGPKLVELSTTTPESWADFPTKSGGTTRGHGRLRISVFANLGMATSLSFRAVPARTPVFSGKAGPRPPGQAPQVPICRHLRRECLLSGATIFRLRNLVMLTTIKMRHPAKEVAR